MKRIYCFPLGHTWRTYANGVFCKDCGQRWLNRMREHERTTLPHHRRYQWQLVYRSWRRALLMILGTGILAFLIYMAEMYLLEQNKRLNAELKHQSLILDVHRLATLGAPGYVRNDWSESTTGIYVRKPK